ncbi:hypothetical protein SAMN05216312_12251 [Cohnella sp. OV330]|uniref:hypothetical protein n=1 Tax=Cohnella sp. OV330 TaxID=1855288 RepID=UPI0008EE76C7|nr:hypothetical protein [Cohnella sp. OV330]SFB62731.1 hypothetical protein SAMN05216312_12251 [Cohnella sp. OV330]
MTYIMKTTRIDSVSVDLQARHDFQSKFFPDGIPGEQIAMIDFVGQLAASAYRHGIKTGETFQSAEWSNNACLGYAILAAEKIGLSHEQIRNLTRAIHGMYDFKTIGEARDAYEQSPF